MTRSLPLIFTVLACTALLACYSGPPPVLASAEVTQAAMTLQAPPADRARVFVLTGRGPIFTGGTKLQRYHGLPADIYVNNVKIGTVNSKEAMVFDVAPGQYSFSWMIYNQKVGWGEEMRPSVVDVAGGTLVGLSADYAGSTTYFMTSAVLDNSSGQGRLAPDMKVVRAAHCPPTICI